MFGAWRRAVDDGELGAGDLLRHVAGTVEEGRVECADHDERRHRDRRQRIDHPGVVLGQHAPSGVHEPGRPTVPSARELLAAPERVETPGLERRRGALGHGVPLGPGLRPPEPRPGADQHERGDAIRVGQVELEGQVPAERVAGDDGAVRAHGVQERDQVADRELG